MKPRGSARFGGLSYKGRARASQNCTRKIAGFWPFLPPCISAGTRPAQQLKWISTRGVKKQYTDESVWPPAVACLRPVTTGLRKKCRAGVTRSAREAAFRGATGLEVLTPLAIAY